MNGKAAVAESRTSAADATSRKILAGPYRRWPRRARARWPKRRSSPGLPAGGEAESRKWTPASQTEAPAPAPPVKQGDSLAPRRRSRRRSDAGQRRRVTAKPEAGDEAGGRGSPGRRRRQRSALRALRPSQSPSCPAPAARRRGAGDPPCRSTSAPPRLRSRPAGRRRPRRDQRDRDRLRHQPQRLLGRCGSAGCSSCRKPGPATGSTPTATGSRILQPRRRDLRRRQLPEASGQPADC